MAQLPRIDLYKPCTNPTFLGDMYFEGSKRECFFFQQSWKLQFGRFLKGTYYWRCTHFSLNHVGGVCIEDKYHDPEFWFPQLLKDVLGIPFYLYIILLMEEILHHLGCI